MNKVNITMVYLLLMGAMGLGLANEVTGISMLSGWLFQKGDNMDWKAPEYDDADWISINPIHYWGYLPGMEGYDGYGWYRMHVYIPSDLKKDAEQGDSLHIRIGRVDDNDQTFLNGMLIGENGRLASKGSEDFAGEEGAYAKPRNYTLPFDHPAIKWDAMNVIAVRAYDYYLTGGLVLDNHAVYIKPGWRDDVGLERESSYMSELVAGKPYPVKFAAKNTSEDVTYDVTFFAVISMRENGNPVMTYTRDLHLGPSSTVHTDIEFTPYVKTDYEISYRLVDKKTGLTLEHEALLGMFLPDVTILDEPVEPVVKDKVPVKYGPVDFPDIRVRGLLAEKMELNRVRGLNHIPYQLTAPYIEDFVPPWCIGEFLGKLMHGNTKGLQYFRDDQTLATTTSMVNIWLNYQDEDGYMGTNAPEDRWQAWDVWDHKYIILALVNYYAVTGYEPALVGAKKIGDLVADTFGYGEGQLDLVDGYQAGMAPGSILEPMVYLYKYTGDQKYFDFCKYILKAYEQENGPHIVSELTEGSGTVLHVGNAKAYEMMSCIIGLIQMYKLTGEQDLINAAEIAWNDIHDNHLYITGTAAVHEHFREPGYRPAGENDQMGETCVTSYWMYLSKELFKLFGEQKYMDAIEQSLYNQLLAAQHPVSGDIVYYANYQAKKWYMETDMYLGPPLCCHMSAKRCLTEIPEFSYYHAENELGVVLYNPSVANVELTTADGPVNVNITVESEYPRLGEALVMVNPEHKAEFTLALRVPEWCSQFTAQIGDETLTGKPGEFLKLDREWEKGRAINVSFNFPVVALHGGQSYPDFHALKYGNQVLALDSQVTGVQDLETIVFDTSVTPDLEPYTGAMPKGWVGEQAFVSNAVITKDGEPVVLVPFSDASQTGGDMRVWIHNK